MPKQRKINRSKKALARRGKGQTPKKPILLCLAQLEKVGIPRPQRVVLSSMSAYPLPSLATNLSNIQKTGFLKFDPNTAWLTPAGREEVEKKHGNVMANASDINRETLNTLISMHGLTGAAKKIFLLLSDGQTHSANDTMKKIGCTHSRSFNVYLSTLRSAGLMVDTPTKSDRHLRMTDSCFPAGRPKPAASKMPPDETNQDDKVSARSKDPNVASDTPTQVETSATKKVTDKEKESNFLSITFDNVRKYVSNNGGRAKVVGLVRAFGINPNSSKDRLKKFRETVKVVCSVSQEDEEVCLRTQSSMDDQSSTSSVIARDHCVSSSVSSDMTSNGDSDSADETNPPRQPLHKEGLSDVLSVNRLRYNSDPTLNYAYMPKSKSNQTKESKKETKM